MDISFKVFTEKGQHYFLSLLTTRKKYVMLLERMKLRNSPLHAQYPAIIMCSYLEIVIITVALISWRLNVEIVPKVHPHKVPIICTDCPKALDPRRVVSGEARREELLGHWVSVGKVLAEFLLEERVHSPADSPSQTGRNAECEE